MTIYTYYKVIVSIIILHFSLTHIYAMQGESSQQSSNFNNKEDCVKKMNIRCMCEPSNAINCVRAFILTLDGNSNLSDQEKEYYDSFNDNFDTSRILDPRSFCRFVHPANEDLCIEYLVTFGNSSISAFRHALYNSIVDLSLLLRPSRIILKNAICKDESNALDKLMSLRDTKNDMIYNYILHIIDNIQLTSNQKSPLEFCEELFGPKRGFKNIVRKQIEGNPKTKFKRAL